MDIFNSIINILFGVSIAIISFLYLYTKHINKENEKLKNANDIDIDEYNELKNQLEKEKDKYKKAERDNIKMKKYLGLVSEKEYGILLYDLEKKLDNGNKQEFKAEFEFKVIGRGDSKVKIDIQDVKSNESKTNGFLNRCKELANGWYDENDSRITWIKPDKTLLRDSSIDDILSN